MWVSDEVLFETSVLAAVYNCRVVLLAHVVASFRTSTCALLKAAAHGCPGFMVEHLQVATILDILKDSIVLFIRVPVYFLVNHLHDLVLVEAVQVSCVASDTDSLRELVCFELVRVNVPVLLKHLFVEPITVMLVIFIGSSLELVEQIVVIIDVQIVIVVVLIRIASQVLA